MLGTMAEEVFENLKNFLSPGSLWQKVLVSQNNIFKSFGTPTTTFKIAQEVLVPLLQLYYSFHTPDIEQKNSKQFNSFLKLCFKMILIFKNNTSPDTMKAP